MNKLISKEIFLKNKIKTPRFFSINKSYNISSINRDFKIKKIKYPIIVKPINEGSSLGVELCIKKSALIKSIKKLKKKYDNLMIEQYIPGQEIQVAVINGKPIGQLNLCPNVYFTIIRQNILDLQKQNM